jgi:carbon starvation protein CstA
MARCMTNEKQARPVFFGAMISESLIALIWAAIAMAFFGGVEGLNTFMLENGGNAGVAVSVISDTTLGVVGGILAVLGVVAAPITSGDTAFRSARLIIADVFHIEQRTKWKRLAIALPLFTAGVALTFVDFDIVWRYFAWTNQALATVVLWCIVVYLFGERRNYWVALLPAVFMTYICSSFVFVSNQFVGMGAVPMAYVWGGVVTIAITAYMIYILRAKSKK